MPTRDELDLIALLHGLLITRCCACGLVKGSVPSDTVGVSDGFCVPCADAVRAEYRAARAARMVAA